MIQHLTHAMSDVIFINSCIISNATFSYTYHYHHHLVLSSQGSLDVGVPPPRPAALTRPSSGVQSIFLRCPPNVYHCWPLPIFSFCFSCCMAVITALRQNISGSNVSCYLRQAKYLNCFVLMVLFYLSLRFKMI